MSPCQSLVRPRRIALALALALGATLGSACLDTAPLDECFEVAEDEPFDEVEVFHLEVEGGEDCPSERHRSVKQRAEEHLANCFMANGAKLRYVACGPREEQDGFCEYVAVFDKPVMCGII